MVRAPCCEKMGLKKGPWTPEEDQILISYIQKHGHGNWRALPKLAGLLRCGKSCRLRWINYLRPDIKRGNFSNEEEETIIKLHEMLGNRWSAIAAKLPGRTDNEIKNVWHTHLKKRLMKTINEPNCSSNTNKRVSRPKKIKRSDSNSSTITTQSSANDDLVNLQEMDTTTTTSSACTTTCSSDFSSFTIVNECKISNVKIEDVESLETMPEIDESFWSEEAVIDDETTKMPSNDELPLQFQFNSEDTFQPSYAYSSNFDDGMDFWYDIFIRTEDPIELPNF